MSAPIKDPVWTRISQIPRRDVDEATQARIRDRALAALTSGVPSRSLALAHRIERIWTDFFELPMTALVIVACMAWLLQGTLTPSGDREGARLGRGQNSGASALGRSSVDALSRTVIAWSPAGRRR
jgi:hypothetical protein